MLSTDNVGVTAYDIYRNSTKIDDVSGPTTSYQDTSVNANTTYAYFVRARDAAGNQSSNSNTVNVTTPPFSGQLTFTPTDDTYIKEGSNAPHGNGLGMLIDSDSRKDALLRFDVTGIGGSSVSNVTLRLNTTGN